MRKRHYPKKLKIGKVKYKLSLVPYISETKSRVTRGQHFPDEKVIKLLNTMSEKAIFTTLIHEVLHAIETEHKIKIKHKLVYALEEPLSAFITDNFYIIPKR